MLAKITTILLLSGFCLAQPGRAGTRRNIHPLTPIVVINHPLSASSIYYDPWYPPHLIYRYVPDSLFAQFLSKFSLGYIGLALSTSYSIHFFNQSLLCFRSKCAYHCSLFCFSTTEIMSSNPSLSQNYK